MLVVVQDLQHDYDIRVIAELSIGLAPGKIHESVGTVAKFIAKFATDGTWPMERVGIAEFFDEVLPRLTPGSVVIVEQFFLSAKLPQPGVYTHVLPGEDMLLRSQRLWQRARVDVAGVSYRKASTNGRVFRRLRMAACARFVCWI